MGGNTGQGARALQRERSEALTGSASASWPVVPRGHGALFCDATVVYGAASKIAEHRKRSTHPDHRDCWSYARRWVVGGTVRGLCCRRRDQSPAVAALSRDRATQPSCQRRLQSRHTLCRPKISRRSIQSYGYAALSAMTHTQGQPRRPLRARHCTDGEVGLPWCTSPAGARRETGATSLRRERWSAFCSAVLSGLQLSCLCTKTLSFPSICRHSPSCHFACVWLLGGRLFSFSGLFGSSTAEPQKGSGT